ncbi:MAG: hypothetical protein IKO49_06745 [Bacilli bacterium]|nr:hypothetical protein [Bacilli bacterium]
MKKLNNRGLSIVEILVCFVIVSVISITLLNTIMEYKSLEQTEAIRSNVLSYKNVITHAIQNDIISHKLNSFTIQSHNIVDDKETLEINMKFLVPFQETDTKVLKVYLSYDKNYIVYPDEYNQPIKYVLEATDKVYDYQVNRMKEVNNIRFSTPIIVPSDSVFSLDIPIYHSELSNNYHIHIVAPLTK